MAPVNPTIQPTNSPSYGRDSTPVNVPDSIRPRGVDTNQILPKGQEIGDRSAEFEGQAAAYGARAKGAATEGFADLFSGLVRTGDFMGRAGVEMVKRDIENRVYDAADSARDDYIKRLEAVKEGVGGKNILDAYASADVPTEVSELKDRIQTLSASRDSGKISSTYYQGRLLAEAKDLRARYPNFRQEIDAAFTRATGSNPANAYVHSLIQDINRNSGAANSTTQHTLKYIEQNLGIPGAQKLYERVISGQISGDAARLEAVKLFAPHEALKVKVQEHKARMEDTELTRTERSFQAEKLYEKASAGIINNAIDGVMERLGLTDANAVASVDADLKNKAGLTPQQWEQEGQNLLQLKARLRSELIAAADKHGVTANLKGGKKELIEKIDASLSQFDTLKELIYAQDTGTLFSFKRSNNARLSEDVQTLMTGSKTGPILRQVQAFKSIGGENYMRDLSLTMISEKFPTQYKDFFERWSGEIASQSNYGPTGKPVTFNDFLDEVKNKRVDAPEAAKKVLSMVDDIANPKTPDAVKEDIALAAFSTGNIGMISRLVSEDSDPKARVGQNTMYRRFTTPEITKEMKRLGERNPEIWKQYVNWAENTLGSELLNREIANLNKLGKDKDPNISISWSSDNKRFEVKYNYSPRSSREEFMGRGTGSQVLPVDPMSYPPYVLASQSINRINSNLSNFKHIAEAEKSDIEAFLLRTVRNIGGSLEGIGGIPQEMLNQIDATRSFQSRFGASQRGR